MHPDLDVVRVESVFHLFAVDPVAGGGPGEGEAYVPGCLALHAARELGYFPTHSPEAARRAGRLTYDDFLHYCAALVDTRGLPQPAVHDLVRGLGDGAAALATEELCRLLTAASPTISNGELRAIVELLDPDDTGAVPLPALEMLLVSYQHAAPSLHISPEAPADAPSASRRRFRAEPTDSSRPRCNPSSTHKIPAAASSSSSSAAAGTGEMNLSHSSRVETPSDPTPKASNTWAPYRPKVERRQHDKCCIVC